jgi:O-antigen ligase
LTDRGRRRWLWAIIAVVMLAALVFTGSRGAWLAFGGAIGLALLFLNRKLFIGFIIVAVLAALFVPQISSRFEALFNPEYLAKSSENGRIQRWIGAYDQMRMNPIFGVGLGHHGGAVADRHFGTIYVDSYYFKTLAETGMLGLGVYLWLMFVLMRNSFAIWKRASGSRQFFLYGGVFIGLLAVVLHNGVENIFEVPFMNTFFWLLAGVLLSLPFISPNDPGRSEETPVPSPVGSGADAKAQQEETAASAESNRHSEALGDQPSKGGASHA